MKEKDVVMVLTRKSIETMQREGGTGNWRANEKRLCRCRWVVAVRNQHTSKREGDEEHGSAFLLGRIVGLKPSVNPEQPERFVIAFDRYALLDIPKAWRKGHRNPIAYTTLGDLGIDPDSLQWKDVSSQTRLKAALEPRRHGDRQLPPGAVLEEAKRMIASSLSIAPSAVSISIQI